MGTAVLRSHHCLGGRFIDESLTLTTSPLRLRRNPNPNPNPNSFQSHRRKRSPVGLKSSPQDRVRDRSRYRDEAMVEKAPGCNLVMGQVKILKRGESLSLSSTGKNNRDHGVVVAAENRKPKAMSAAFSKVDDVDLALGSTNRMGPDPEMVQKQVRVSKCKVMDGLYAGSGAFSSAPPPSSLPLPGFLGKNDAATSDLRRLLQLDLA